MSAYIGTSGYQYDHWRGLFYPDDLPRQAWFSYYAERLDSLEINNSFYGLPDSETFDRWRDAAPRGFTYALKFSRFGSHMKKLKDPEDIVPVFVERARRLKDRAGPILVQLPGNWRVNCQRLEDFLAALPDDFRWAFEFRDRSWLCDEVFALLERHNVALVVHDMLADHPQHRTADFVYWRFHGTNYRGNYSHQHLSSRADDLAAERRAGRDAYVFFNNDAEGHAPANAIDLARYLERR